MRAAVAAAASCSLVLVAGGAAALSTLGVCVGLGLGVGVLAEGADGGSRTSPDASNAAEANGEAAAAAAATEQLQRQQPKVVEVLKPLVLDDFATVVHVTEPILQKEKEQAEGQQQLMEDSDEGGEKGGENDQDDANNDAEAEDDQVDNNEGTNDEQQQQQQPATTASEALHDDSLSSIPPLPSDLVQLADDRRENAMEVKEMVRDALDSKLGEYDHGQGVEETEEEGQIGEVEEGKDGAGEEGADGTSDETSGAMEDGGGGGDAADQQDGTAEPSGSESAADNAQTSDKRPADSTVDQQPADATVAESTEATEDSPKNRVVVDYASKAAGELVLEKSPNLKGTSNLLNNDNDKYAIAPCDEERKYVVIGLSEDILVKQIVLANYERYSSHPKEFQVLGSQTYPDSTWIDLGTYTAQPGNNAQTFDLIDPTWARYLKLRFITHYGAEHYCTVSQIKVHGSTMLQGFHEQWKESEEEVKKVIEAVEGEDDLDEEDDGDEVNEEDAEEEGEAAEDMVETSSEDDGEKIYQEVEEDDAGDSKIDNDDASGEKASASIEAGDIAERHEVTTANTADALENEGAHTRDDTTTGDRHAPVDNSLSGPKNEENDNIPHQDEQQTSEEVASNDDEVSAPKASVESMSVDVTESDAADAKQIPHEAAKGSTADITDDSGSAAAVPTGSSAKNDKPDESSSNILTPSIDASFGGDDDGGPVCIPYRYGVAPTLCADVNISDMSADPFVAAMNNFNRNKSALSLTSIARESADSTMSDGTVASMIGNLSSLASVSDAFIRSSIDKASHVIRGVKDSNSVISTKNKMEDTRSAGSHHAVLDMIDDSAFQQSKKPKSPKAAKTSTEKDSGKKTPPKKHEEALVPGAMDAEVFAALANKYPAASCIKDLNYQEFKTKIIEARAKKKPAVVEKANGPPQPGKIEPIFKTLTDEIKSLQLSQSVYDQYIKAVTSCYQRIILDVTNELKTSESVQAERLSLLEDAIRDLQSQSRGHSALESVVLPILALIWFAGSSFLGALVNLFQPQNWFVAADVIPDSTLFGTSGPDYLFGLAGIALSALLFVSFIRRKSQRRFLQPRLATNGDTRRSRSAPDVLA